MKHPGPEAWEQGSPLFTRRRVPGSCSSWSSHQLPGQPALLYFSAADSSHNYGLYQTDGTAAGTTLIESLGYALFLTNPVFEENFDVATYLLRSGKKAGEIDVTFDHEGQRYRLSSDRHGAERPKIRGRPVDALPLRDGDVIEMGPELSVRFTLVR